jgi:S-adenosylmethionine hydrolase
MKIISLLTDFGTRDEFVGVMKGVIWGINPHVHIVDISHEVGVQDILQGALLLGNAYRYFPPETVHVAVVDPGVGTQRRAIAAKINGQFFVGPDNGIFSIPIENARANQELIQIVSLENPIYRLPNVSSSFHGRDIFAPAAAHLALGLTLDLFGSPVNEPVLLPLPKPHQVGNICYGEIIQIDRFGNLITNLERGFFNQSKIKEVQFRDTHTTIITDTFAEAEEGELVAMFDSSDRLSLCVVNGNAASRLGASRFEPVTAIIEV